MNLNEERNYQKLMDVLEALGLSEKNQAAAEEYFAPEAADDQRERALRRMELQDFSELPQDKRKKSSDYVEHLKRRKRTEELSRYVRFAAAAGGSTAYYLLCSYGWNLRDVREYLRPEQEAAMETGKKIIYLILAQAVVRVRVTEGFIIRGNSMIQF